ncbi:MAG: hypothetical protein Pg6A_20020 [Termitinemataceae bacterium]|nr:MAG: hypothetical protein Pg6A_20020 [Termitinemataceae bacterium]
MDDTQIVYNALVEASAYALRCSNDFHTLHLNVRGCEFDTLHKVMERYYTEAGDDYDSFSEWARYYAPVPNKNTVVGLLSQESMVSGESERDAVVDVANTVLGCLTTVYKDLYNAFNAITDDPFAIGVTNFIQTRLEYWAKEMAFFNKARGGE